MASTSDKAAGRVLLPPEVEPQAYAIAITPDLASFTFSGHEDVTVEVTAPTSTVQLHARELYISAAKFTPAAEGAAAIEAVEVSVHLKEHVATLTFPSELPVGAGVLAIDFVGEINNQMAGFYRSQYVDATGAKKWMGSTQFEALDARRAFPCWDEPSRKATFTLTLTIPKELEALSNMPEATNTILPDGAKRKVTFLPTPKMSTYLLAWCVGEFDSVAGVTKGGVLCKVYTPPGRGEQGRFALDVGIRTLDLYDDFFRVPYPLPKMDMIAIMDFAMGAMENWGLVTYREVDLLIDDAKATSQQRQRVCSVVTHELAHQWFGNLVTMAWWDDLWLNEGFASWAQTMSADKLFPDWDLWTQFVCDDQAAALRLDALKTSHPIQVPIRRAEEVEEVFDAISYCKGASVVKMLHAVLGAAEFQAGLQLYMERHQYGNTETFHLWRAWEEVSGKPIGSLMATWTEQMGFPLLEVQSRADADGTATFQVSQQWFLADGSAPDGEAKLWTIPMLVSTAGAPASLNMLMSTAATSVKVPLAAGQTWVKLNAGQDVPMRVAYDAASLTALCAAVQSKDAALGPEDRAGLLNDAFALAKAGHPSMPPGTLLEVLAAFRGETNSVVWEAIEGVLVGLHKLLLAIPADAPEAPLRDGFAGYAARLVAPAAAVVGWTDEEAEDASVAAGHLGKLLRATIVRLQARFAASDPAVAAKARAMWDAFFVDPSSADALPSDLKVSVFKIVLQNGGENEFNQLLGLWGTLESNAEKKQIYNSLGATANLSLKRRVLEWTMAEVKLQDFFYAIGSVSQSSPEGLDLAWSFYQENFAAFKAKLAKASASLMDAAIVYSVSGFATTAKADEIEQFFQANPLPQSSRKIAQTVEGMRTNARFLGALVSEAAAIRAFLDSNQGA